MVRAIGIIVASTVAVLAAGAAWSDSPPVIKEGSTYASARGLLMSRGFKPVASGDRDSSRCPAGRQDVCDAYPETVSCSGTGSAPCRFIFSGKDATMTIVADGPSAGRLRVVTSRRSAKSDAEWQRRR